MTALASKSHGEFAVSRLNPIAAPLARGRQIAWALEGG
jgi:hypothetical protein